MQEDKYYPNRRKYPRKAYRKTLCYMSKGQAEIVEGVEIGEGGISFKSCSYLDYEQKLIINFFLTEGDFFSVRVTLKNIQNTPQYSIYGVSFDDVSIALKRQIRAYVARTSNKNDRFPFSS